MPANSIPESSNALFGPETPSVLIISEETVMLLTEMVQGPEGPPGPINDNYISDPLAYYILAKT